ncbi:conserved exported hypothetical protein [Verrucomicrobia bacterium]|nr:conserved exported hypothetical protein [Verrucomicrobiota bacterium]
MKTRLPVGTKQTAGGYALLLVLSLAAVSVMLLMATMNRAWTDTTINANNNQFIAGQYAAEAATEKVLARIKNDYLAGSDSYVQRNLSNNIYSALYPLTSENPYWGNFIFSDGTGAINSTHVGIISNTLFVPLQSQYYGLNGYSTVYRVLSNVQEATGLYHFTNAVQQDFELDSIPVFQFAVFYNSLLEFVGCCTLTVNGRVHANGDILVGSPDDLTFNSLVTTTGAIYKTNYDGYAIPPGSGTMGSESGATNFNYGPPGYSTNVQALELPIGSNTSPSAVVQIIQPPPTGEDPTSQVGQQRYYNKAQVVLLITNSQIKLTVKTSSADPSPTNVLVNYGLNDYSVTNYGLVVSNLNLIATNFPFLSLFTPIPGTNHWTNIYFQDQREGRKSVLASQIDMGKYNSWLLTNSAVTNKFPPGGGAWPNILYIADTRTGAVSQLMAVRITNGLVVPTNGGTGFTLATMNPLYVWGNYNAPTGTTNATAGQPASLICDALTVLSSSWQDVHSSNTFSSYNAANTVVNAAVIAGVVYSTGPNAGQYSGGVMNLPRLLENWGSGTYTLTMNTSIVNFYNSLMATNQFQNPGNYYYAPTRQFYFNPGFSVAGGQPPGTPNLGVIFRDKWAAVPPNNLTYNPYAFGNN